jgi:hypothetical protein
MRRLLIFLPVLAWAGCSSSTGLASPSLENVLDTVTLASLSHGALRQPAAYSVPDRLAVLTFQTTGFDFLFDFDSAGRAVVLPLAVVGLSPTGSVKPGLLATTTAFDDMVRAPLNGYVTDDTIPVTPGDRFYVRSRPICTDLGGLSEYARMEVLAVDSAAQTLTFQVVADDNCGYRSLALGYPNN